MSLPVTEPFTGSAGALAGNWTQMLTGTTMNKDGGGQSGTSGGLALARYDGGESWPRAQYAKIKYYTGGGGQLGGAVLLSGSGASAHGYGLLVNGALNWTMYRIDADGSYTAISTLAVQAVTDGHYVEMRSDDSGNFTCYYDATLVATSDAPDTTYTSGQAGIFGTGNPGDDWEAGAVGGGGGGSSISAIMNSFRQRRN